MDYRINVRLFFYLSIIPGLSLASSDPFRQPTILPCQTLAAQLMEQISGWRYQGVVMLNQPLSQPSSNQSLKQSLKQPQPQPQLLPQAPRQQQGAITIWLNNQTQWLAIKWPSDSDPLLPWHLTAVSAYQLHWQAQLPRYCTMTLTHSMSMMRRER